MGNHATEKPKAVCFTMWFQGANNVRYADLFPRLESVVRVHKVVLSRHRIVRGVQYRLWRALDRKVLYPGVLRYLSKHYETLFTGDCNQIAAWPRNDSVVVDVDDPVFTPKEVQLLNLPQVRAIVVTTNRAKEMFEKLGVKRPICIIPQGVSMEHVEPSQIDEIRRRFKADRDVVVGYPAPTLTLSADGRRRARGGQDDLDFLFSAFEKARESEPRLKLWLIGRPSEAVQKYAAEKKDASIHIFGYVPFPKILHYISNFDVGVYPRTWVQPPARFNLKLAQFMAFGLPVVSTDRDESFILNEARSGIICRSQEEFSKALVTLAQSAEIRSELGNSGRAYARRNLDWSVLVPAYKRILVG